MEWDSMPAMVVAWQSLPRAFNLRHGVGGGGGGSTSKILSRIIKSWGLILIF
jgi:hypothetical protein